MIEFLTLVFLLGSLIVIYRQAEKASNRANTNKPISPLIDDSDWYDNHPNLEQKSSDNE